MTPVNRIARRFAALSAEGRAALVTFVTAGDPDERTSAAILAALPEAGADLIEVGMPFSDPMADGPAIQASSRRALRAGQTVRRTLEMIARFRQWNSDTPIVLMGYFNPVYVFGVRAFVEAAAEAGVDGLIVVDLPPEEAEELRQPARQCGLDIIFLTAPTSDDERLATILERAAGFVYHVSITGITGTTAPNFADVEHSIGKIRARTTLPIAVGFGIRTAEQAAAAARIADAAVVGSALVSTIAENLDADGRPATYLVDEVGRLVASLSDGVRRARRGGQA